jgi:hypothetical protein
MNCCCAGRSEANQGKNYRPNNFVRIAPNLPKSFIDALHSLAWLSAAPQVDPAPSPSILLAPDSEPIPNYRLTERFGRGGFADGKTVWLFDAGSGRDLLDIPPQPSVVQTVGYTGAASCHYIAIGTTENGVSMCLVP